MRPESGQSNTDYRDAQPQMRGMAHTMENEAVDKKLQLLVYLNDNFGGYEDIQPRHVALTPHEVNAETKVYVGWDSDPYKNMFDPSVPGNLANVEHVSLSPKSEIQRYSVNVGGITKEELLDRLQSKTTDYGNKRHNIVITENFRRRLQSPVLQLQKEEVTEHLVQVSAEDLLTKEDKRKIEEGATLTMDFVVKRAELLGLVPGTLGTAARFLVQDKVLVPDGDVLVPEPVDYSYNNKTSYSLFIYGEDAKGENLKIDWKSVLSGEQVPQSAKFLFRIKDVKGEE